MVSALSTVFSANAQSANLFPPASVVGFAGPTSTGAEPEIVATAPRAPFLSDYFPLVHPDIPLGGNASFDSSKHWGSLSPAISNRPDSFATYLVNSSALIPPRCELLEVHMLHRHGARYPSSIETVSTLGARIANATGKFTATGEMAFLTSWKYGLGAEILTPFGRKQLFDLGVSWRIKYGHLLDKFPNGTLPVFRTTSQDRMVKSALNFAAGFFGIPYENQYHQEIIIEGAPAGVAGNNTLSPTCKNLIVSLLNSAAPIAKWQSIYLANATARINAQVQGINFTFADVGNMQSLCAYETVAVGYSDWCKLFTVEEWEGFEYTSDFTYWYGFAWGAPTAAAMGVGWVQELVARLTHTPITVWNTSTNSTLDSNPLTFPVNQSLIPCINSIGIASFTLGQRTVMVALNFTSFAKSGPLPVDHIPVGKRSFVASQTTPFATALVAQVVNCTDSSANTKPYIRWLLNDASIPVDNIPGCGKDEYGRCPLDSFVDAMKTRVEEINFAPPNAPGA
ncbi:phosphoglycerate mutase-like protein [Dacryopinax primogenitus]|uniref:Phosphoglycerate mutase-like protein n=1 Tax=Dacryopinax primogenitus (strain DJM 731) TaxID=1858805 RepID=M5FYQ4_DACPD|nr:phosphoglycerate mutase-like protein [Dacryopinax primogenitus]EJU01030.1 phosphoglycerate mutase-like protein [Dacryopinax primogenitus]